MAQLRQRIRDRHPGAAPTYRRRLLAALACVLATVAPIAPATALTAQADPSWFVVSPVVLAPPQEPVDSATACRSADTADEEPGDPATFRSKKTSPPAVARLAAAEPHLDIAG